MPKAHPIRPSTTMVPIPMPPRPPGRPLDLPRRSSIRSLCGNSSIRMTDLNSDRGYAGRALSRRWRISLLHC